MDRVIVTRPSPEAEQWAAQLRALDIVAESLPLINIGAVRSPDLLNALAQARSQWAQYRAVMFVSGNAVAHFFAGDFNVTDGATRFWAPGPGTATALLREGVTAGQIDSPAADSGQFDSESLWNTVHSQIQTGDRVLIVRGGNGPSDAPGGTGREWLAAQIRAAGGSVELVAAYERHVPQLNETDLLRARAAATGNAMWLFSSSEAVENLRAQLPEVSWDNARALVTHPRIALAARTAGFGVVSECRPTLHDVAASIKSHL